MNFSPKLVVQAQPPSKYLHIEISDKGYFVYFDNLKRNSKEITYESQAKECRLEKKNVCFDLTKLVTFQVETS